MYMKTKKYLVECKAKPSAGHGPNKWVTVCWHDSKADAFSYTVPIRAAQKNYYWRVVCYHATYTRGGLVRI